MAAQCEVIIAVNVTELGNEINKRVRYTTANTPEAIDTGYGTIAAANTYEALPLSQVAASVVDLVYLKPISNTIYAKLLTSIYTLATSVKSAGSIVASDEAQFTAQANVAIPAGEANVFNIGNSLGTSNGNASIYIMASTAGATYEYLIVGQSS